MPKIGFRGLGEMGTPMATRLRRAGHDLTVWNRATERTASLANEGAAVASSPAKAAAGADVVITMLATPEALEQVLFGSEGLATALSPGQILIDMSTVGPDEVRSAATRLPEGVALVDAPVRGSVPQATSGRLEVFAGATDQDYERVRPILELLGTVRHARGPGSGPAMKLSANLVLGAAIVTLREALALGDALDLISGLVLDVLAASPIGHEPGVEIQSVSEGEGFPESHDRRAQNEV